MAEVHTKDVRCTWPAHILTDSTHAVYGVICQGVGTLGEQPPIPKKYASYTLAKAAADAWVVTCGLTPS